MKNVLICSLTIFLIKFFSKMFEANKFLKTQSMDESV